MIHWLLHSATEFPAIERGEARGGWLSAAEAEVLGGLTVSKRRRDWLLGRWTAKELVRTVWAERFGVTLDPAVIEILAAADGAPVVRLAADHSPAAEREPAGRPPWSLSISHSRGIAFCALVVNESAAEETVVSEAVVSETAVNAKEQIHVIGADIEFIEPRDESFVGDFFAPREVALVRQAPPGTRDALVTAVWSGKEAVLKVLRTGLRLDTRQVQCLIRAPLPVDDAWHPFELQLDAGRAGDGDWSAWWRRLPQLPDFVLTLALRSTDREVGRPGD